MNNQKHEEEKKYNIRRINAFIKMFRKKGVYIKIHNSSRLNVQRNFLQYLEELDWLSDIDNECIINQLEDEK